MCLLVFYFKKIFLYIYCLQVFHSKNKIIRSKRNVWKKRHMRVCWVISLYQIIILRCHTDLFASRTNSVTSCMGTKQTARFAAEVNRVSQHVPVHPCLIHSLVATPKKDSALPVVALFDCVCFLCRLDTGQ